MTETKKGLHYCWWILVSCCFMYAGSMALINSIISVYVLPVTEGLTQALGYKVGRGDFTFMLTTQAISIIIAMPIWGKLFNDEKVNLNLALTIGALTMIACPLLCGFAMDIAPTNPLIVFYVAGFIGGIGMAATFSMATPILCGNWFAKKYRGKMIGIASAFAGVSTIFWAPLFKSIIASNGWAFSYKINALLMAVLILPWTLFVMKRKPEDKGLEPFGYDPEEAKTDAGNQASAGVSAKAALKSPVFWLMILGVMLTALGMGWNNSQSGIAREMLTMGLDPASEAFKAASKEAATVGAAMVSAAALGNLISKLAMGAVIDKLKIGVSFLIFCGVWLIAFILWYFAGTTATVLIAGGFCLGFCNAPSRVGWSMVVRKVFGNKDYSKIWGYACTGSSIFGGFATSIMGWTYDAVGSYKPTLIAGMIIICVIIAIAFYVSSKEGKMNWTTDED